MINLKNLSNNFSPLLDAFILLFKDFYSQYLLFIRLLIEKVIYYTVIYYTSTTHSTSLPLN